MPKYLVTASYSAATRVSRGGGTGTFGQDDRIEGHDGQDSGIHDGPEHNGDTRRLSGLWGRIKRCPLHVILEVTRSMHRVAGILGIP